MHKIGQSGGFLGSLLEPLLKTGLPLMKNLLKLLAESVIVPLELTATALATDAAIHKKMFGSGMRSLDLAKRTAIISNEEMNDITKIVQSLEESGLLIKGVSETIKNEAKERKGGFLSMFLGTLANLFAGKGTIRAGEGATSTSQGPNTIRTGEGTVRAGQDF